MKKIKSNMKVKPKWMKGEVKGLKETKKIHQIKKPR